MSEQLHKEGRQAIESATRRGDDLVHACLLAMALDALKKAESERDTLLRRVEAAEKVCELVPYAAGCCAPDLRVEDGIWRCGQCSGCQLYKAWDAWRSASEGAGKMGDGGE